MNVLDWTRDGDGIAYQVCGDCDASWYFQRGFCPACGAPAPVPRQASGRGTVHARTLVTRAPTDEMRAHAPYLIVLVDAAEGFRLMAHGTPDLQIGDPVQARYTQLAGKKIPYFEKA